MASTVKLTLVHEGTKTGCNVISGGFPEPGLTIGGVPSAGKQSPADSGVEFQSELTKEVRGVS